MKCFPAISRKMRRMSHLNGVDNPKDEEEKEVNHLDRILNSSACRKIFTWARPKNSDSRLEALDEEMKQEQRLRWNFDFETETPLPGRYQWIRTDSGGISTPNGGSVRGKVRNGEAEPRTSRQKTSSPYVRSDKKPHQTEEESLGSSSTSSHERASRRSERTRSRLQVNDGPCLDIQ